MTPRERWLKTMRGEVADRVPLVMPGCELAAREDIARLSNPNWRRVAERIVDQVTFDVRVPSHINRMLVTPGSHIHTEIEELPDGRQQVRGTIDTPRGDLHYVNERAPESDTTWHVEYPVKSRADIARIMSVPWEAPAEAGPTDIENLPADFGRRGVLETRISSPFVCAAGMMPFQDFLELCATDLGLVKELTEICRLRVADCLKRVLLGPDIDCVWIGGSEWLTPPMASPRLYDALVQEQERKLIEYVHTHSNAVVHIHCHGRVCAALPKMIERCGDYTEPVEPPPDGDIRMAEAKELAAGRITLGGNVECRLLANGTEPEVDAAVREAFEGGKERFILRPTERPLRMDETEFRNVMRMIDVWDELSPI